MVICLVTGSIAIPPQLFMVLSQMVNRDRHYIFTDVSRFALTLGLLALIIAGVLVLVLI